MPPIADEGFLKEKILNNHKSKANVERLLMKVEEFDEETKKEVNNLLYRYIEDLTLSDDLSSFLRGGKRFRPLLCILSFKACEGSDDQYLDALHAATAIELSHSASLCHDDIIDRDLYRRDSHTLWVDEGVPKALLKGHLLISQAMDIILSRSPDNADIFLSAWKKTLRGVVREVELRERDEVTFSQYLDVNKKKTGCLFASSAKLGARLAGAPEELVKKLENFGMEVGLAYQFADDLSESLEGNPNELLTKLNNDKISEDGLKNFIEERMKDHIEIAENIAQIDRLSNNDYPLTLKEIPTYFTQKILESEKEEVTPEVPPGAVSSSGK